jgi:DNA-binding response OmpR family regulator
MGPAMRVLIACSDADVRDAFLDVLRRAGIGVIAVADWAATLELARQQRPDVVLVDDELPGIGGVAGLPRLAAESPASELVVLAARFDRGVACARSWRAPAGTSVGWSRPRRFRASFAV